MRVYTLGSKPKDLTAGMGIPASKDYLMEERRLSNGHSDGLMTSSNSSAAGSPDSDRSPQHGGARSGGAPRGQQHQRGVGANGGGAGGAKV
jgi:hypothetical protein